MRTYQIEEEKIEIAESAKDISIEKLVNFINETYKTDYSHIQFKISLITLLTSLSNEEIEDLEFTSLKELVNEVDSNFLNFDTNFTPEVIIDGVKYTARLNEGKFNLKIKDSKILQALVVKYRLDYIYYLPALIFRNDWSKPVTIEEIEANKDIFQDVTVDIIGPYVMYISNLVNEKGI